MCSDGIERRYALPQTTKDYLIEVLIDEQPQHGLFCDKGRLLLLQFCPSSHKTLAELASFSLIVRIGFELLQECVFLRLLILKVFLDSFLMAKVIRDDTVNIRERQAFKHINDLFRHSAELEMIKDGIDRHPRTGNAYRAVFPLRQRDCHCFFQFEHSAMIIHYLKPPRVMIVVLAASLIFATSLVASYFRPRAIDPRVTMEVGHGATAKQPSTGQTVIATMIDGEVARTAERIGEATALALSASLYATSEQIKGRSPLAAQDLLAGIAAQNLLPPGLAFTQGGALASAYGSLSVRYRTAPLGVEVVSVGRKPEDGPALIVRIPDELSDKGESRLFIARSLSDVRIPAPFAPAAEVIALGWSPETLRSLK